MKLQVQLQRDHLKRLVERYTPINAVAELVWNALDGDATRVDVFLDDTELGAIESIRVVDNGDGIPHEVAVKAFGDLGDSWKKGKTSPSGRPLHGEKGEGRFAALAVGNKVRWSTRWRNDRTIFEYEIDASITGLGEFDLADARPSAVRSTGTEVEIANIERVPRSLVGDASMVRLAELFALYLIRHKDVQVWFAGERVDPSKVWERVDDLPIPNVLRDDGQSVDASVTVIEWKHKVGRELVLCDGNGCVLATRKVAFHTPGYNNFSAYLKSDLIRERQSVLDLSEMHDELQRLVEASKSVVKDHFRARAAEAAKEVVEQWKVENVYPYQGLPESPVDVAERQVFDVVALNIAEYSPDFSGSPAVARRLTFQILKAAIEQSPETVRRIFQEVLELPAAKREELVELLNHVSLSSIISANKVVVDRQKFLAGLHVVLYDYEAKQKTKERQHLQRLVADNAWIFGEEYHLAVDDQGLETVLAKHLELIGDRGDAELNPVIRPDGKRGIVDLMLSKRVRLPRADEYEHLVVELKRPSQVINAKVLQQVEQYAFAVADDERFRSSKVRWVFWALSNDMDQYARHRARQSEKEPGVVYRSDDGRVTIWAKTWNQVLDEANGRMQFYRDQLNLMVSHEDGVRHLQRVHAAHLPDVLKGQGPATSPDREDGKAVLPELRRVEGREVRPFENCIPIYADLKVAAGPWSDARFVEGVPDEGAIPNPGDFNWVEPPAGIRIDRRLFVAQVVGQSMNNVIPDGSWCLWRLHRGGEDRLGKVVLARHRELQDDGLGAGVAVKVYEREQQQPDGTWTVVLHPNSTDQSFGPVTLTGLTDGDHLDLAEFVAVLT
jgi:hypothetical protein